MVYYYENCEKSLEHRRDLGLPDAKGCTEKVDLISITIYLNFYYSVLVSR